MTILRQPLACQLFYLLVSYLNLVFEHYKGSSYHFLQDTGNFEFFPVSWVCVEILFSIQKKCTPKTPMGYKFASFSALVIIMLV